MRRRRHYRDRTVVVTGAAGGLGAAFARRFGAAGARVVLLDVAAQGVDELARELNGSGIPALGLAVDITDPAACKKAIGRAADELGGPHVLINNAGISHRSLFPATDPTVIRKVMDVNFFGSVNCTRAALPGLLQSRGQLIVISTVAGFAPLVGRTGYAASKHALHGFFDTLRAELKATGVGVLIACPGFARTGLVESAMGGDGRPVAQEKKTLGRESTPEEVAEELFRAATADRRLVVMTPVGKLSRIISRLTPAVYERIMIRSIGPEFGL